MASAWDSSSDPAAEPLAFGVVSDFDDILAANRVFAAEFDSAGFDGIAHAGVAVVTCMDSRIKPLEMVGLELGDAKILRNPGGRVTTPTLEALVIAVHLLNVDRILIVPHTRCAVASNTEDQMRAALEEHAGRPAGDIELPITTDQIAGLEADVRAVREHPLVPAGVRVGGFLYDVDSGLLDQKF